MPHRSRPAHPVAALVFDLGVTDGQPPKEFRLFPAGRFAAADGRQEQPAAGWLMTAEAAARLIAAAKARRSDYVIDYEHQTLLADQNGKPAPAAGWIHDLQWRDGDGLYVVDPQWTAAAAGFIAGKEYRYVSPVFSWDRNTGEVLAFFHAALTNNPGLDGLTDLAALSVHFAARFASELSTPEKDRPMKTLLAALGLAETATEAEGLAALTELKAAHATSITALKGQAPDPAQYVPIATYTAAQTELAALKASQNDAAVEALVQSGLADGRILPAAEAWARDLGKKDLAALKGYLDTATPVAALKGTQTQGKPADNPAGALSADELAVCKAMGISAEDFAKTKQATAA